MSRKHIHKFKTKVISKAGIMKVKRKLVEVFSVEHEYCRCGAFRLIQRDTQDTPRVMMGYLDDEF